MPKPKWNKVTNRPQNRDPICALGQWIDHYSFEEICSINVLNLKVETLNFLLLDKFHEFFPTKVVPVFESDKPWIPKDLMRLIKLRCRLYSSRCISASKKIRNSNDKVSRHARKKYVIEKITPLFDTGSSKWHSAVRTWQENQLVVSYGCWKQMGLWYQHTRSQFFLYRNLHHVSIIEWSWVEYYDRRQRLRWKQANS